MTVCTVPHNSIKTRYCHQCGAKVAQPLEDLRAHLVSQSVKSGKKGNEALHAKWVSWIDALDEATAEVLDR